LQIVVELIEPLGSETVVHGRVTQGHKTGDQALVVKLAGPFPAADRMAVWPKPDQLHVFDRVTGRRIGPIGHDTAAIPLARTVAAG
jgi:sn-glycerol 3-phosphate transport system ATP-binding protein